ncbi:MAG: PilN domain-containing protein [Sulfurihydrogenibium sp.]|nr:PilN domain-containing protein [Sulfurihydrogenibium sp.]
MIRINLNPTKGKRKRFKLNNTKKLYMVLSQVIVISTSLLLYAYIDLKTNELERRKTQLLTEKNKLKIAENTINKLKNEMIKQKKEKNDLDMKFETLQYLINSKKSLLAKLNSVVLPTPNGLWLESVELSKDSAKITGNALDPELIARYQQYLDIVYKNIIFNGTERKVSASNITFYNFSFEIKDRPVIQKEGT